MLLQITPKVINRWLSTKVELVSVEIPELGLTLKASEDLKLGKPFPNKQMSVACVKKNLNIYAGFCVRTDRVLTEYSVITNWMMNGDVPLTHQVDYEIVGDGEVITDNHMILNSCLKEANDTMADAPPCHTMPHFTILFNGNKHNRYPVELDDTYSANGTLVSRKEKIRIKPISVEQYEANIGICGYRMPSLGSAFDADTHAKKVKK